MKTDLRVLFRPGGPCQTAARLRHGHGGPARPAQLPAVALAVRFET